MLQIIPIIPIKEVPGMFQRYSKASKQRYEYISIESKLLGREKCLSPPLRRADRLHLFASVAVRQFHKIPAFDGEHNFGSVRRRIPSSNLSLLFFVTKGKVNHFALQSISGNRKQFSCSVKQ
jgi:hypothetical protein